MRRLLAALLVAWILGFLWFAVTLPKPAGMERTDAIVVPTGSGGRIQRGLDLLRRDAAEEMLVTGVGLGVRPGEFAAQFRVEEDLMACCITLGFDALDTRGNARETAAWMRERGYDSLRLVTADWHLRRVVLELEEDLPPDTQVLRDAISTEPSLWILFVEYNKLLAAGALHFLGRI